MVKKTKTKRAALASQNDLALAQTPRENAGDTSHAQDGAGAGTESEAAVASSALFGDGCFQCFLRRHFKMWPLFLFVSFLCWTPLVNFLVMGVPVVQAVPLIWIVLLLVGWCGVIARYALLSLLAGYLLPPAYASCPSCKCRQ